MKCREIIFLVILVVCAAQADEGYSADDVIEMAEFGSPGITSAIVNGTVSEHIPYMASIRLISHEKSEGFGYGHFCGGVFVSKQHVLTLASCLSNGFEIKPDEIEVIAGTRYRYEEADARKFLIEKYVLHPDYTMIGLPNNLAILTVS